MRQGAEGGQASRRMLCGKGWREAGSKALEGGARSAPKGVGTAWRVCQAALFWAFLLAMAHPMVLMHCKISIKATNWGISLAKAYDVLDSGHERAASPSCPKSVWVLFNAVIWRRCVYNWIVMMIASNSGCIALRNSVLLPLPHRTCSRPLERLLARRHRRSSQGPRQRK